MSSRKISTTTGNSASQNISAVSQEVIETCSTLGVVCDVVKTGAAHPVMAADRLYSNECKEGPKNVMT